MGVWMINLERRAGLPIFLRKDNKLTSKRVNLPKPDVRTLKQIRPVLLAKNPKKKRFYYMYRNVAPDPAFTKHNLRYDITVIPGNHVGREEIKTTGHYHAHIKGTNMTYPEVYQVIKGKAVFLFQKRVNNKITDVIVAKAKAGDIVLVPPNYGHITINPSKETLVMANFVYGKFKSQYKDMLEKHGGAYYGIEKDGKVKFIKNPNYKSVPKIRYKTPRFQGLKSPIHTDCIKNPEKYLFLVRPQKYKDRMNI